MLRLPQDPTGHHPSGRREAHRSCGWDQYLSVLEEQRVPENQRQSYAWQASLSEWQFRQMVDAVQLLVVDLKGSAGAREVDRNFWKEAAGALAVSHLTPEKEHSTGQAVQSGARHARSTDHDPGLKTLARTLRARQYAIRTEQIYVDWCHRLPPFADKPEPDALGQTDVERCLEVRAG